jgi:hypothetical protein
MLKKIETKEEFLALGTDEFVIQDTYGNFLLAPRSGSTLKLAEAYHYRNPMQFYYSRFYDGSEMWSAVSEQHLSFLRFVPDGPPTVESLFSGHELALFQQAPRNEIIRSIVMAKVGLMPPDGLSDYQALKTWIEANAKPTSLLTPQEAPSLDLQFKWRGTEFGKCSYYVKVAALRECTLTCESLLEASEDCRSMNELLEVLTKNEMKDDDAMECLEPIGDYDYEDHYLSDDSPKEIKVTLEAQQRERLEQYINTNMPELAGRLGL